MNRKENHSQSQSQSHKGQKPAIFKKYELIGWTWTGWWNYATGEND